MDDEMDAIQIIWQRVAEDYAPFDVNVTTQDPGFPRSTGRPQATRSTGPGPSSPTPPTPRSAASRWSRLPRRLRLLGALHTYYQPAWCFSGAVRHQAIAECVSHEVGHNLGLDHDGQCPATALLHRPRAVGARHGGGLLRAGPQFSKGEYADATNTEDDFAVMASHGVMPRTDDHTNVDHTATVLIGLATGIVSSSADYDLFSFTVSSTGSVTFVAGPAPVSPNLDVELGAFFVVDDAAHDQRTGVTRVGDDIATGMGGRSPTRSLRNDVLPAGLRGWPPHRVDRLHPVREHRGVRSSGPKDVTGTSMCNGMSATIRVRLGQHAGHTRRRCDRRQRRR